MNKVKITVISPLLITAVTWLIIIFLYVSRPVEVLYISEGWGIILITMLFLALTIFSLIIGYKKILHVEEQFITESYSLIIYTWLFLISALIEVALNGLPPVFTGADYTSWGISGLHGFINVLSIYISYWYFSIFLVSKNKRLFAITIFIVVFSWQVMVLNRAILMLNLIGLLYIAFSLNKLKVKHFIISCFIMIILMGLIGDLRGMGEDFIFIITSPKPWAKSMGVGFVWVLTYFTTSISNLIYNLDHLTSINFSPFLLINEFLPNIFKFKLDGSEFKQYDGNFNASTIMRPSILAFGLLGPIITIGLLLIFNILNYSRKKNFDWFIFTTFFASSSVLSCYENTIFTPWMIFMLFLSFKLRLRP
jgi:oligosaccharide repeat unit polymerase